MLKDMPLCRYYDEVALPGMQLAAKDAELGILTAEQQDNIRATLQELVEGLSEQLDKKRASRPSETPDSTQTGNASQPATPGQQATILSIAGRGPLDEPAAIMLGHLLKQSGLGSRLVKYREASRLGIETLDLSNVVMVCIAYLNISGSPAHLRYLVQRLRARLPPGTPILIGLWSPEDTAIRTDAGRVAISADYFTSSFGEVLKSCQAAASSAPADMPKPGLLLADP